MTLRMAARFGDAHLASSAKMVKVELRWIRIGMEHAEDAETNGDDAENRVPDIGRAEAGTRGRRGPGDADRRGLGGLRGLRDADQGACTVNVRAVDEPPPGVGLRTNSSNVPAVFTGGMKYTLVGVW
jgi:hypothetical protein